jgi:AhpD family alkylhydroperoxidase
LNNGELPPATRKRIALAVAEINGCTYCFSAHTYLGKNLAKLDDAEITANRNGASNDPKADAAVRGDESPRPCRRGRIAGAKSRRIQRCGGTAGLDYRNHQPSLLRFIGSRQSVWWSVKIQISQGFEEPADLS